jgi:DNA repair protein SbcC/Rad50
MIINKLELTNFRRHRKLEVKLKTGVTGIIGDNGTGKSSIVEALQFVLTGEHYGSKKIDAITLGEDFGSVRMTFTLNGKTGTITRFLSGGTLQLSYGGGGTKKKAGDVKELWESLLQVGPEIISKVIIAKQGDIPLLFSGSSTIREKIFQKIFLVPNTERIRSVIQKNYLQQMPPLLYVEDPADLTRQLNVSSTKLAELKAELAALHLNSREEVEEFKDRIKFINRCETDAGSGIILQESIAALKENVKAYDGQIKELQKILSTIKIEDYELQRDTQLQQKELYNQKKALEKELKELDSAVVDEEEFKQAIIDLDALEIKFKSVSEKALRASITYHTLADRLSKYKSITAGSVCDTCGQPLHSVVALIEAIKVEKEEALELLSAAETELAQTKEERATLQVYVDTVKDVLKERERLIKTLDKFKDLTFDQESLTIYMEVIAQFKEYTEEMTELVALYHTNNTRLKLQQQALESLAIYDNKFDSSTAEKEFLAECLQAHEVAFRQSQILQVDLKMKEMEVAQIKQRQAVSKDNLEKNKKRKRYSELLGIVLDTLSIKQFPRKLILNYADVVTTYLQEKLQSFNIPYTAKVGDDFEIEMFDDEGRKLPCVSGGQEIQVGISLHLALHELFSQSFPLLVIDEGTTHLDTANRKAYFDMIKKLKTSDKLQQILIIDHDAQLSEVVDNVIELEPL